MARAKVVHSEQACEIVFYGHKSSPEPQTGVISFPGGHVEVSRHSDGSYWAHVAVDDPSFIVEGRIDRAYSASESVESMASADLVKHIAVLVDSRR